MKTLRIKSISLRNFKGAKEIDISFNKDNTNICGDNATFKTTIFDAFTWLLFGKDSADRQEFDIIPLDSNNKPLEKVDNEVSAILDEDGAELTLRRVHHQKWVKRRGSTEVEYVGNETLFYYNGVPQKASEYKQKIESIMNESVFKLVTNPLYFNTLPWQNRREVLTDMAGGVTIEEIGARLNGGADSLLGILTKGKPVEEYQREISARKKKINDDLGDIPTRIDEINRFIPEAVDAKSIQKQIEEKQNALDELDQQIADVRKQSEAEDADYRSLRDSLNKLKDQAEEIRRTREKELNHAVFAQNESINQINLRIGELQRQVESAERQKDFELKGLEADQKTIETLRQEWTEENGRRLIFDEDKFICPTCKREYEAEDINTMKQEMTSSFMADKKKKLEGIDLKGSELKGRIELVQNKIKELDGQLTTLKFPLSEAEASLKAQPEEQPIDPDKDLEGNLNYQDILESIKELEEKVNTPRESMDITSHSEMKRTINAVLDDLKKQLTINESRQKSFERIEELKKQEKDLSQQLADLEKTELTIMEFIKARTDLIESRINDKFSMVRFKMFEQQINRVEIETCQTLIDGVPFPDANNGAKINAGLDIINALSSHYEVSAPIFIDNKESVNELIPCESQLINLVVTKDKALILT